MSFKGGQSKDLVDQIETASKNTATYNLQQYIGLNVILSTASLVTVRSLAWRKAMVDATIFQASIASSLCPSHNMSSCLSRIQYFWILQLACIFRQCLPLTDFCRCVESSQRVGQIFAEKFSWGTGGLFAVCACSRVSAGVSLCAGESIVDWGGSSLCLCTTDCITCMPWFLLEPVLIALCACPECWRLLEPILFAFCSHGVQDLHPTVAAYASDDI